MLQSVLSYRGEQNAIPISRTKQTNRHSTTSDARHATPRHATAYDGRDNTKGEINKRVWINLNVVYSLGSYVQGFEALVKFNVIVFHFIYIKMVEINLTFDIAITIEWFSGNFPHSLS